MNGVIKGGSVLKEVRKEGRVKDIGGTNENIMNTVQSIPLCASASVAPFFSRLLSSAVVSAVSSHVRAGDAGTGGNNQASVRRSRGQRRRRWFEIKNEATNKTGT